MKQIARRLEERAPAEPLIVQFVWRDVNGEEEVFQEMEVDGQQRRTVQFVWPEDEDDERRRATKAQDARNS